MSKDTALKVIDETMQAIERFHALDPAREILSFAEADALESQRVNLGRLRHKLATDELEVAVVGLEKAGKSKFSSAFVNKPGLFPSADERCTFTSTALRYGETDRAVVEFYTQKDFRDKVAGMLSDVAYPASNIDSISLGAFQQHFEALKETDKALYNLHANKTESDLTDIIEGRTKINPMLGHEIKTFTELSSPELNTYITDKQLSRAVKSVTFYSSNLTGLENIVLYDVPGFDSPTLVHLNQTIEKLKQVDAIVMVKNVKMPSLKGGEVDILVKNSDMDGIPLGDKLFVFGSYADAVSSNEQLAKNKSLLTADLSKSLRKNFSMNRMFTGCLDAQYEHVLTERGGKTETTELKEALRAYSASERADILFKRINRSVEEIKTTLRAIVERTQIEIMDRREESGIVLDLLDESRSTIDTAIPRFINPIKAKIQTERGFTQRVIDGIDACMPALDQAFIEDTLHEIQSSDTRNVINFTKLNLELRDRMATKIKEAVTKLVLDVSMEDARIIHDGILKIVLDALRIHSKHPKSVALTASVTAFIEQQTASVTLRDAAFKPLIERFIVDLIDTMILQPLGYDSRRERFLKAKADLYMLSMFSANAAGFDLPYRSPLVAAVLAQKLRNENSLELADQYRDAFKRAMPKASKDDSDTTAHLALQFASTLAEIALNRMIPLSEVNQLVKTVIQYSDNLPNVPKVVSNFQSLLQALGGGGKELEHSETNYLNYLLKDVRQANNEDDVKTEIENDLGNLVYLFKDCVVAAMNLELPFVSAITLMTERLREVFQSKAYREFLSAHVRDVLVHDFDRIDSQSAQRETRIRLVNEMREVLVRLERGYAA